MLVLAVAACAVGMIAPAAADAARSLRTSFLLSRSYNGGIPNGPSRNPTISKDQRIARMTAFESDASNIVRDDTNGVTDVFMVRRSGPWKWNGTPWTLTRPKLVSRGMNGKQANGASYQPAVDGSERTVPRCIAFVSEASNLVRGDTNGVADVFVKNLRSGSIRRVSITNAGVQANGPSSEPVVSGNCQRVAFTSSATNLAMSSASKARKALGNKVTASSRSQIYMHIGGTTSGNRGRTLLASSSSSGGAGNGSSTEPSIAINGTAIAFTSLATNLTGGDSNDNTDVYVKEISNSVSNRVNSGLRALTKRTRLVSQAGGHAGNGDSNRPAVNNEGGYIAYETDASNILPGDHNRVADIARANLARSRPRSAWVSKSIDGQANGPSANPTITTSGAFVLFDSGATNLRQNRQIADDDNHARDMFLWNDNVNRVSLESRNWENDYLTEDSRNPQTSSRGNYVLFESVDPNIDRLIRNLTGEEQVYMRYLGPK
jgi:hypothetical protein